MLRSQANVTTDSPERYAKQLASHLGHKITVTQDGETSVFTLGTATGRVTPGTGELVMVALAETEEELARVEDVLGRHLVRFGERQGLTVDWSRA